MRASCVPLSILPAAEWQRASARRKGHHGCADGGEDAVHPACPSAGVISLGIMAQITAQLVKDLRERTGAGMMECKKALLATNGDIGEAEVYLRKQGLASDGQEDGTR